MVELNAEVVAEIQGRADALRIELERLNAETVRIAESGTALVAAAGAVKAGGAAIEQLCASLNRLAGEVAGLDPAALAASHRELKTGVDGLSQRMESIQATNAAAGQELAAKLEAGLASLKTLRVMLGVALGGLVLCVGALAVLLLRR